MNPDRYALIVVLALIGIGVIAFGESDFLRFTDPPFLYDDTLTVFFNETYFNETVSALISETQVTYLPANLTIREGSWTSGNITSILSRDTDFLNVSETLDGYSIVINFSGIIQFNQILLENFYQGTSSHEVNVSIYNYSSGRYNTIGTYSDQSEITYLIFPVTFSDDYVQSGNASVNIIHQTVGNPTHLESIGFTALKFDSSGGAITVHNGLSGRDLLNNHIQYLDIWGIRHMIGNFTIDGMVNVNRINSTINLEFFIDDIFVLNITQGGQSGIFDFNYSDIISVNQFTSNITLIDELYLTNNEVNAVATDLVLNAGDESVILQRNGIEICRTWSQGLRCGVQVQANNKGSGVASMVINASGGVYDTCLFMDNDGVREWYICMDDSAGDNLVIGLGSVVGGNQYVSFGSSTFNVGVSSVFSSPVQFQKTNYGCLPQTLDKNPTTIDVSKGCLYTTNSDTNTTVTSITSTDGQFFDIVCNDNNFQLQDNENIHVEGGSNYHCVSVGDTFRCEDWGAGVTCGVIVT